MVAIDYFTKWVKAALYTKLGEKEGAIMVAIDYFTKWVKAALYTTLREKEGAKFIKKNIICQYGVPHEIILDHGGYFKTKVKELFEEYKMIHHKSSPYRP